MTSSERPPPRRQVDAVRVLVVVFVGLAVLQTAACLAPFFSGRIENDFTAFYSQWSLIHAGRVAELYDASAQGQTQRALMGARPSRVA